MIKVHLLLLFALVLILPACTTNNNDLPYKVDKSFSFKVSVKDSNKSISFTDTLSLTIKSKGILGSLLGMNMSEWVSNKQPEVVQERGVNIEPGFIEIQMPIGFDYLNNENIVISGYPTYSTELTTGSTTISEHKFLKGYGKLGGLKIKQLKEVRDSSRVSFGEEEVNCKVMIGRNQNYLDDFGLYEVTTYYSDKYGFLKLVYNYPNGKIITFDLIELN